MNLLAQAPIPEPLLLEIRALAPELTVNVVPPGESPSAEALRTAEILYAPQARFPLEAAPNLRWLQTNTAAINQLAGQPILASDVIITNGRGAYTVSVAECAMAMLLTLTRRIPKALEYQRENRWELTGLQGDDLYGKTIGILGYGSIGRHAARLASAAGMRILACKRRPEERAADGYSLSNTGDPDGTLPERWFGIEELPRMLPLCEVLLVTLPLSEHTRNLIGAEHILALPSGSYLINIGRGGVVNEADVITALRTGHLAGAALDVFSEEPLPSHSPLWQAPNLLILPHIGSWSTAQPQRAAAVLLENLRRYLSGQPLLNLVDKTWMY